MNTQLPGWLPLRQVRDLAASVSREELGERLGTAFLVLVSGELARPVPMQRTVTWDEGSAPTLDTGLFVARLVPKALDVRTMALGRTANNDIVLVDTTISKVHAFLHRDGPNGATSISDAQSHNGTFVEGERVATRGDGAPTPLRSGQSLRLGSVALTYLVLDDLLALGRSLSPA
ncbi:MAG: FHA domain-containing protein [Deltaproteobacteria bacterium]|nr:FHA domain-containing protein [Deltaproteobacteria bacterium]